MEEIARVYAESLFAVARDRGKLDPIREQLGQVADALDANRQLAAFFFSPYFSSEEKRDGLARTISGADPELANFLEALVEKHRMPVLFRIRRVFEELWAAENRLLDVSVTSAVELGPGIVEQIGGAIEKQTGRAVRLSSRVDDGILGGLVVQVGNMVLDASIKNRLEKFRKQVAAA